MDAFPIFLGLCLVALAIVQGLYKVAEAIAELKQSRIDVRLPDEINVKHRNDNGTPT